MNDCISVEDVVDFRVNCEPVNICCPAEVIQENLDIAYEIVGIITGQDWCPETSCKLFNGTGIDKLFFQHATTLPLMELESIEDLSCCGHGVTFDLEKINNFGHYIQIACDTYFPCGERNIRICGLWGKELPASIRKAIIMMTLELIQPGSSGLHNPNGVRSATWEDFRISYSIEERPRGVFSTGFQELDDLLALHTNTLNDIHFIIVPENENCAPRDCGMVKPKLTCRRNGRCENC